MQLKETIKWLVQHNPRAKSVRGSQACLHDEGVNNLFSNQFGISGLPWTWIMPDEPYLCILKVICTCMSGEVAYLYTFDSCTFKTKRWRFQCVCSQLLWDDLCSPIVSAFVLPPGNADGIGTKRSLSAPMSLTRKLHLNERHKIAIRCACCPQPVNFIAFWLGHYIEKVALTAWPK